MTTQQRSTRPEKIGSPYRSTLTPRIAQQRITHTKIIRRRPDWAGGGLVSNLVSALIGNKFLYGFMKIGARNVLIKNAEKKGVEVRGAVFGGLGVCVLWLLRLHGRL